MRDAFGVFLDDEVSKAARLVRAAGTWRPMPKRTSTQVSAPGLGDAMSGITAGAKRSSQAASAQRGSQAMSSAMSGINRRMAVPPTPRSAVTPTPQAAAAGDDAVNSARGAMRSRSNRRRNLAIAGGTAGTAVAGGGAVALYDKNKRPRLAG
jgi:hypothetical protein